MIDKINLKKYTVIRVYALKQNTISFNVNYEKGISLILKSIKMILTRITNSHNLAVLLLVQMMYDNNNEFTLPELVCLISHPDGRGPTWSRAKLNGAKSFGNLGSCHVDTPVGIW